MGTKLWLYQTKGLYIIGAPDTDVTTNPYSKKNNSDLLNFNFAKVNNEAIFTIYLIWINCVLFAFITISSFSFYCRKQ